ncbi:MAG: succinate dehydrogenase, cytochrome b556 subunit [Anaerolineae bacterium]|nr:succinate dehydrogenase, cytochrome b556 subunit [Anaerolineae bacterium]NUQ05581.1 succinate dehydrogenase, cytochrome b556 subunit [Anaerolineae bacterium]
MTSLVLTISETLRYRGAIGQWSWVLHRISGLGVVLFLTLHVIDTSWAVFYPELYVDAIAAYQSPVFTLGEFGLVACVIYHALNGLRIVIFDARPKLWKHQARAAVIVLAATAILLIPTFLIMFAHVLDFYNEGRPVMNIVDAVVKQAPFAAGIAVAIIAAVLLSAISGVIIPARKSQGRGSTIERFWWSFMRVSGLLIVPLVFGHLAMIHLIQGVFDITLAGHTVVGTTLANETGTAVEFVANRWGMLVGGVAVWKLYDFALLALVVIHGFNGLRYVLTDYTSGSRFAKSAAIYLCVIGAVVLLTLGGLALLNTIDSAAIELAQEATRALHGG